MSESENMTIQITTPKCQFCGLSSMIEITDAEYSAITDPDRGLIQNVLPDWTPEQRELLITGTHPDCWDHYMKDIDDEEDGVEV